MTRQRVSDYAQISLATTIVKNYDFADSSFARRPGLAVLPLEDRVAPARPLPDPVIAVGPAAGVVKLSDADTGAVLHELTPYAPGMTAGGGWRSAT